MSTPSLETLSRKREATPSARRLPAWLVPVAIFAGFALLFAILFRDRLLPSASVETTRVIAIPGETETRTTADPGDAAVLFQASGWIEPDPYIVRASTLIDGVIDEVFVLEGEKVEKGDLLATLIDDDQKLKLSMAEREYERRTSMRDAHCAGITRTIESMKGAQARIDSAKAVRHAAKDRLERLEKSGTRAVSERDIVDARLEHERVVALQSVAETQVQEIAAQLNVLAFETVSMEHNIEAAKVAVDEAELALNRTRITAPISGRVMHLDASPGQKRMLGMDDEKSAVIADLYDPAKLQVRVDVPLADAAGLQIGQPARIRTNLLPNDVFAGVVTRIVGQADLQRNTLQAKVAITDPHDALRPEMLCRVEFLEGGQQEGETITSRGIQLYIDEAAVKDGKVWVVDPDSQRIESRDITLGSSRAGRRTVTSGLRAGEELVLNPNNLRAGQRINPTQP